MQHRRCGTTSHPRVHTRPPPEAKNARNATVTTQEPACGRRDNSKLDPLSVHPKWSVILVVILERWPWLGLLVHLARFKARVASSLCPIPLSSSLLPFNPLDYRTIAAQPEPTLLINALHFTPSSYRPRATTLAPARPNNYAAHLFFLLSCSAAAHYLNSLLARVTPPFASDPSVVIFRIFRDTVLPEGLSSWTV